MKVDDGMVIYPKELYELVRIQSRIRSRPRLRNPPPQEHLEVKILFDMRIILNYVRVLDIKNNNFFAFFFAQNTEKRIHFFQKKNKKYQIGFEYALSTIQNSLGSTIFFFDILKSPNTI